MESALSRAIKSEDEFYLIGETAYNHEGDKDYLLRMVDELTEEGVDAVKFHILLKRESYMTQSHPLYEKISEWLFDEATWEEIIGHALKKGLEVIALCDDLESIEFIKEKELRVAGIELHAVCLNDYFMLSALAESDAVAVLGIGGSENGEIEYAVKTLKDAGKDEILLMYGFQSYPTDYKKINLRKMKLLEKEFALPVGYADHTSYDDEHNIYLSTIAFAMGSRVVEKHYTPEPGAKRIDHEAASGREAIRQIRKHMDLLKDAMGSTAMSSEEKDYGKIGPMKKAIVAARDIKCGDRIELKDLAFKRTGETAELRQKELMRLVGLEAGKDIGKDEIIKLEDLK